MAKHNPQLYQMIVRELGLGEKQAFVPQEAVQAQDPAAGGPPPIDPATGMPMDPAMGGGAPPVDPATGMTMDPAMMDPAAGGGMPPEEMAPDGLPVEGMGGEEAAPPVDEDTIKDKIKEVLTETGVIKPPKVKPEEQYTQILSSLEQITKHLGLEMPSAASAGESNGEGDAQDGAAMTPGMAGSASGASLGSMESQPVTQGPEKSASTALTNVMDRLRNLGDAS